jgi:crotonobetainyl-CoA:carnitine CoA-transferase CaiB-like acyl-CoA transferase
VPQHHRKAPALGEDTDRILAQAGFSSDDIARLRAQKAVA